MQKRQYLGGGGGGRSFRFGLGSGVHLFTQLGDEPGSYVGAGGKFVVVNMAENALEFIPLPPLAITDTFVVNSQVAMLALVAQTGDVAIRTDTNETYILRGTNPAVLGDWQLLLVSPSHAMGGALHTADTIAHVNTKLSDGSLITSHAAEISILPAKALPTVSDLLLIEDAADTSKKKSITIGTLPLDMLFQRYFYSPQSTTSGTSGVTFCNVNMADTPVNSTCSMTTDGLNPSINAAGFAAGSDSGFHIIVPVPSMATNIGFQLFHKPAGATGNPPLHVQLDMYGRSFPNLGLPSVWSAVQTSILTMPITQIWSYTTVNFALAALGLVPGILNQIAIYRNGPAAGDDMNALTWHIQSIKVTFT